MAESVFDPDAFLNTEVDGALATTIPPIPEDDFRATVDSVVARSFETKKGETRHVLEITWEILDESVKEVTKLDKPTARQTVWLDITPQGSIDMSEGRNVGLGRVREAVGQNGSGPWSPAMLVGSVALVHIVNTPASDGSEDVYNNVKKVARA